MICTILYMHLSPSTLSAPYQRQPGRVHSRRQRLRKRCPSTAETIRCEIDEDTQTDVIVCEEQQQVALHPPTCQRERPALE